MSDDQPLLKNDVESGTNEPLYPTMMESPDLRWSFIRKIYTIVAIQLLLTVVVSAIVVSYSYHPVVIFVTTTRGGLACYILIVLIPFITLCPLSCYYQSHPVNYVLLGIFTITLAFAVGLSCAFTSGEVILEAVILTAVVVVCLTLYTFWAAKRGHDFSFLRGFMISASIVFIVFTFIQIFFPLGRISLTIYSGLYAIIFGGYIAYDTDDLIKRYTYDEYIWASVVLYLDIVNLFLTLVRILSRLVRRRR
ncbi:hypothetical protein L1987_29126 [Smallanthus sonchifolius]|uniref:Uncharacterized protein n=1 Tax=Smallanthus sonchifolius TaxID=185202 RepID=A0ACB9I0M9_9ASTR|nr:hypothetical protein L1987_29126 [Smallanthus sonchifolius]